MYLIAGNFLLKAKSLIARACLFNKISERLKFFHSRDYVYVLFFLGLLHK
jgi:hypothetical protein